LSKSIIKIENVNKIYRVGKDLDVHALRNVNLEVKEGEILIIMGPSGSGKSTLLNIIGTLDKPTSGRVIIDGIDVTHLPEKELYDIRLRKIGFVFQFFNLISTLTALENVMLPMILLGELDKEEIEKKAKELLEVVGLGDKLYARPIQMSGGQQQRVAIARALANDPAIVLMDEPTGSVDIVSEAVILKLIQTLNKFFGVTFIIVTHNPEVSIIGHRIVYIRGGKLFETREIPRISIDNALDEKQIIRSQIEFLKRELIRLKNLREKGVLGADEYTESLSSIKRKLEKIRSVLSEGL